MRRPKKVYMKWIQGQSISFGIHEVYDREGFRQAQMAEAANIGAEVEFLTVEEYERQSGMKVIYGRIK